MSIRRQRATEEPPAALAQLQRWMQAVICHPYGIAAGIESEQARRQRDVSLENLQGVIHRSRALTSVERLSIYGNAYYARLLECLREMFSALVHALGEETFDTFAMGYLQRYPSRSYSLHHLADHFVQFLTETRPPGDGAGDGDEDQWPQFMIELAELEWTIDEVFDGPGHEKLPRLTVEQLSSMAPDQWHRTRLVASPSLRLLEFRFPVSRYFTEFRADRHPALPSTQTSYLAMNRRDYVVRRFDLQRDQFQLLQSLSRGACVGDAIEAVAAAADDLDQLSRELGHWFQIWARQEFFTGLAIEPP